VGQLSQEGTLAPVGSNSKLRHRLLNERQISGALCGWEIGHDLPEFIIRDHVEKSSERMENP
jgi:hypothetical protein